MRSSENSCPWADLENYLAKERLDSYRVDGADLHLAISRYLFNLALSESLYPVLQFAEVSLRNAMHQALAIRLNTKQWYDSPSAKLTPWQQTKLNEAKKLLQQQGKSLEHGRIIAELNFGFWTNFFNRIHARTGMGHFLANHAFKHAPKHERDMKKQDVYWSKIRELRNRVFHHERILHWQDLCQQHRQIIRILGWISPSLSSIISRLDRFPLVRKQGLRYWTTMHQTRTT